MSVLLQSKKGLKWVSRLLHRTLPESSYNAIYNVAHPLYHRLTRAAYLAWGAAAYSWRDKRRWEMMKTVHRIMPYSLVGASGLEATYALAQQMNAKAVPGDFVELGVARGGCAALLGSAIFNASGTRPNRQLWLFDSYEGLPDPTEKDFREKGGRQETGDHVTPLVRGSCLGTLEEVQDLLLEKQRFPAESVRFVKGWFENTVPQTVSKIDKIAMLRIDGDWYESTKVCLEGLYDKVVTNGAVIIDDYQSCYGCERAVTEFLDSRNLQVDIQLDGRGGCYWLKT